MNRWDGLIYAPSCFKVLTLNDVANIGRVSLADRLGRFAIGIPFQGKLLKRFRLKEYLTEHDFFLSDLFRDQESIPLDVLVSELFPIIIDSIDGLTPKEIAIAQGVSLHQFIEQFFLVDALVVILNLRYRCQGGEIHFAGYCPNCGKKNVDRPELGISHNIEGVEFPDYDRPDDFCIEVNLDRGFQLGGKTCKTIAMRPLKVSQYHPDSGDLDLLMGQVCNFMGVEVNGISSEQFCGLRTIGDRAKLLKVSQALSNLLPDMSAYMLCRYCSFDWVMTLPIEQIGGFYTNLLRPPPADYLRELLFFLTFGEQAPCKSIHEARQISVKDRNFWVRKLSENYQKQKEEMDKATRKSKSRNTTTY